MIEMGDMLREMGSKGWIGIATTTTLDEATVAQYEGGAYESYQDSTTFTHDELRKLIRDGFIEKIGNVGDAEKGAVRFRAGDDQSYSMDVEGTQAVYEAAENGESPDAIDTDSVFWNAHSHEVVRIDTLGWEDDNLASDLIRFEDGSVESTSTVSQALQEGVWILMKPRRKQPHA